MFTPSQRTALDRLIDPCDLDEVATCLASCGFSADKYVEMHNDFRNQGLDEISGFFHFLQYGVKTERRIPAGMLMDGVKNILCLPIKDQHYLLRMVFCVLKSQLYIPMDIFTRFDKIIKDVLSLSDVLRPFVVMGDSHSYLYNRVILSADGRIMLPLHFFAAVAPLSS